jgi:transposase
MDVKEAKAIYQLGEDAVVKILLALDARIAILEETLKKQERKIAQLSKDSSTSSKRPSSDDITKKKPKTQNKKKDVKRSKGAQPGHRKNERSAFPPEEIDDFYSYYLESCPNCNGKNLKLSDSPPRVVQQLEIKKIPITKEEHTAYAIWCESCQQTHYAPLPPEVVKAGLFKERATALVAYLKNVCHCSFSTIRKFFQDVLGESISRGYLSKLITKVSRSLDKPYEELLDRLPLENAINVDETGHKDNGDRFWTWVFKAELYVLFKIDKSRGSQVLIEVLGKEFDGILGCDYFSAYRKFMKDFNVSIQFCIAHLIRNIKYLITLPDKETKTYGENLLKTVKALFKIIHHRDDMPPSTFRNKLFETKQEILKKATENIPSCLNSKGKEEKTEVKNMSDRFLKYGDAYFEFITNPEIDPTNNIAEQAIRFIVIDRHITQGTRSPGGRAASERLWTVIATCALQGRSAYNFILKAVQAHFSGGLSPSLLTDTS